MIARLCLFLFLGLGLVVSFEDWSHRRIRNRWIGLGMIVGAACFCFLLWNSLLGHEHRRLWMLGERYLPLRYYPMVLVHLMLSLAAAVTLWRLSVWPAGDAKLYTLFAFLLVLIDPNLPGFPLLLFLLILVNIFVPAGALFAAGSALRLALKLPRLWALDWPKWLKAKSEVAVIRLWEAWPYRYEYLALGINLYALFYLMQACQRHSQRLALGPFGNVMVFFLMFLVWGRLAQVLRNKRVSYAALACLGAAMAAGAVWRHWDPVAILRAALRMTLSFGVFLSLARMVFNRLIERESLRELLPEQLRAGSVLSDETWEKLGREKELAGKLGERYSDGLGAQDVEAIKGWLAAGPRAAGYAVYQTIPFAVWIFLGALFTVVRRANLVALLLPHLVRAQGALQAAAARCLS